MESQIETSALVLVEAQPIAKLFERATIDPILEKIAIEVRASKFDITKEQDRKACASLAFKLAKTRTFIEDRRKDLVSGEKKRLKIIDDEGKRIRETLESLQDEVRKPLTDWEDIEKARVAKHEEHILELERYPNFFNPPTTDDIRKRLAALEREDLSDLREFSDRARIAKDLSLGALRSRLAMSEKADADRADLERLRKEQEAREQKVREDAVATKAKADAEAAAARQIQEAKDAVARAELIACDLHEKAERDAETARVKAQRDKEVAVQREKDRVAAEKKAEEVATAKREANKAHCAKINRQALDALVSGGITEAVGIAVIKLIANGKVPNVTINY